MGGFSTKPNQIHQNSGKNLGGAGIKARQVVQCSRKKYGENVASLDTKPNQVYYKIDSKFLVLAVLWHQHRFCEVLYYCYRLLFLAVVATDKLLSSANCLTILLPIDSSILIYLKPEHLFTLTSFNPKHPLILDTSNSKFL